MNNQAPQLNFESWCAKLFPAQIVMSHSIRTASSSTKVGDKIVPESINFWLDFPTWVRQWKSDMLARGFGDPNFAALASPITQDFLLGIPRPRVIQSESDARTSLEIEFFDLVNQFNLDFRPLLDPENPRLHPGTRVCQPTITPMGVWSRSDIVVTDGSGRMNKVALGEIKTPWVIKKTQYQSFIRDRMPIADFGNSFVASIKSTDDHYNMGRALTQIYNDLLTDRLSIGFLATTDFFIFCHIPPQTPKALYIFPLRINRANVPAPGPTPFTVQMGLATLFWRGRTEPRLPKNLPPDLKTWRIHLHHLCPSLTRSR